MKKVLMLALLAFSLSGCGASLPPLNFSVPNVGPSAHRLDAEVKSLTVTLARPDEATGKVPAGSEQVAPLWKSSLEDSLNRMAIFKDDAPAKVSVSVKILKLNIPDAGFSMETDAAARYEIIDRSNGSIIFTTDIDTIGHVLMDYAFMGVTRARESINRAVQNNILQFLQQLETVDLSKPMFPNKAATTGKPTS